MIGNSVMKELKTEDLRCSVKKSVLKNFAKFTGKQLCQSLFFNKLPGGTKCLKQKKRYTVETNDVSMF